MDEPGPGHRRRRSSVMATSQARDSSEAKSRGRRRSTTWSHRRQPDGGGGLSRPGRTTAAGADDDHSSASSPSTSDDVELGDLWSEDGDRNGDGDGDGDGVDEEAGLTKGDGRRRRQHRRRKRRGSHGLLNDGAGSVPQKVADRAVWKTSLVNVALIGSWYLFSLSISIYNKWMFSKDHLDFHFPLFITCVHMLVQFSLAALVLYLFPRFRPRHDALAPAAVDDGDTTSGMEEAFTTEKAGMTKSFYLTRIGPCGAATGLDIGLGNMSLKFITLTFYTMCKSSALIFVLIFAFLFRLESASVKLVVIILSMTVGVVMMVAGETAFHLLGFMLIISAAFFSGFRWALTQILLLRNPATSNPFSSIFYLAPVMFVSLLVIALPVEGLAAVVAGTQALLAEKGVVFGSAILLFPGLVAFLMTSSEFALLQRTSVVTLSICGIFKEVVTISAAGIVFHDPLTAVNVSGLLVTIASIAAYNWIKVKKMRFEARRRLELELQAGRDAALTGESHPRRSEAEPEAADVDVDVDRDEEEDDDAPRGRASHHASEAEEAFEPGVRRHQHKEGDAEAVADATPGANPAVPSKRGTLSERRRDRSLAIDTTTTTTPRRTMSPAASPRHHVAGPAASPSADEDRDEDGQHRHA
ncbi:MAG: Triose-phosphate Transporter [Phylliscum demangeonii]|nr:MAG: Triose-phosphate Transporter [Phylliscum demangeonii]